MFTCTGKCSQCGRCQRTAPGDGPGGGKERLFLFPDDFVPDTGKSGFGIAFDIGTTTVVGLLWDMRRGRLLSAAALTNPQIRHGADVISRIAFALEEDHLQLLQQEITGCLNAIIDRVCRDARMESAAVTAAVIGGNTAMSHFLLGVSPEGLARAPFVPGYAGVVHRRACELGIRIRENSPVTVVPNIAGHIGGDISAGILAARLSSREGTGLFIDIGTNGEIVLSRNGTLWACSAAAGPAFEGASVSQGMRAANGSIDRVLIEDGDIRLRVIGDVPPTGICGSGIIDAAAQMLGHGIIDKTGRILSAGEYAAKHGSSPLCERLTEDAHGRKLILARKENAADICLTQNDIRQIQLAKAAIAAGIRILMKRAGMTEEEPDYVCLAGAFGSFIDKKSAVAIGLLPDIPPEKIVPVGNAAGAGLLMLLAGAGESERLQRILPAVRHVRLSEEPDFQKEFLYSMYFNGV